MCALILFLFSLQIAFLQKLVSKLDADLGVSQVINLKKVLAGQDAENTRKFMHYLVVAAGGGGGSAAAAPAPAPKKVRLVLCCLMGWDGMGWDLFHVYGCCFFRSGCLILCYCLMTTTHSRLDWIGLFCACRVVALSRCRFVALLLCCLLVGWLEHHFFRPAKQQQQQQQQQKVVETKAEDVETKQDSGMANLSDIPDPSLLTSGADARKKMRPTTARRPPPKKKENVEKLDRTKEFVLENVATANIILDGDDDDSTDSEEENNTSPKEKDKEGRKVGNAKNRGKLVQDILNDEKKEDGEKKSKKDKKKDKKSKKDKKEERGIKLNRKLGGKSANRHVDVNIDELRSAVQKICQSTNPLSKCMDFVNNDLERMDKELDLWKDEYLRYTTALEEEEKKTDEILKPLKAQISKLAEETAMIQKQIQSQKAEIHRSDGKIMEMMHFIVNLK